MTKEEVNAIEKAIVAGINTALERVIKNPFPKPQPNQEPNYNSIIFHAKSQIERSVHNELSKIKVSK
jgi:hypothetical protein